jgi:hypothetical protein
MSITVRPTAAIYLLLLLAGGAFAATESTLAVDGRVEHPLTFDRTALAKLPQTSVDVTEGTAHGQMTGHYTGVLLWDLIAQAKIKPDPDKMKHHLQDTILVTGRDGYAVSLSLGELDPMFEGKQVIIETPGPDAGKAPSELRLIVPNDKMAGRAVKDVVRIDVE